MCAMIPMFRVFSSANVRGIVRKVSLELVVRTGAAGPHWRRPRARYAMRPQKRPARALALLPIQPEFAYIVRLSMDWMSARRQHLADARATAEYSRCMMPLRQAE